MATTEPGELFFNEKLHEMTGKYSSYLHFNKFVFKTQNVVTRAPVDTITNSLAVDFY